MKDMLVLSTGDSQDEFRFAYAEHLAATFGSRIDIVLANEMPSPPRTIVADPMMGPAIATAPDAQARDAALQVGAERQAAITARFAGHAPPVVVLRVNENATGLGNAVANLARSHDVTICTLPGKGSALAARILDQVLIESGRAVIGVPEGFGGGQPIRHITIAWNASREATRAVTEAMPLLRAAETVVILLVDQIRQAGADERPGDDIQVHLRRHGIDAKLARVSKSDHSIADAILAEVKRQSSQLLVMGAQAEGGLLRWLQGSVSREVASRTQIPIFMAH